MKILTGALRGRTFLMKEADELRPTADKVRKSIFDTLQGFVAGKRVLDLYSGTGALGFEALSNDAASVCFVEQDAVLAKNIESLTAQWGLKDRAQVMRMDVFRAMEKLGAAGQKFDLILFDPPYEHRLGASTLNSIVKHDLLNAGGFVFAEGGKREDFPKQLPGLRALRERRYGQSRILVYSRVSPG